MLTLQRVNPIYSPDQLRRFEILLNPYLAYDERRADKYYYLVVNGQVRPLGKFVELIPIRESVINGYNAHFVNPSNNTNSYIYQYSPNIYWTYEEPAAGSIPLQYDQLHLINEERRPIGDGGGGIIGGGG